MSTKKAMGMSHLRRIIKERYKRQPDATLQLPESLSAVSPDLTNYAMMQQRLSKGTGDVDLFKTLGKAVGHTRALNKPKEPTTVKDMINQATSRLQSMRSVSNQASPNQIPRGMEVDTLNNLTPTGLLLRELRQAKNIQ